MRARWRRRLRALALAGALLLAVVVAGNLWVWSRGAAAIVSAHDVRPARAAIVFGAGVRPDGSVSDILGDRLETARVLFAAGTVQLLLLSGDHRAPEYDEVAAMRAWLVARGVPDSALLLDGGGIDTYSTVVRAQTLYGLNDVVLVSQRYHLPRALYVARARGMTAQGVPADRHVYRAIVWFRTREVASRLKALIDVLVDRSSR